MKPRRIINTGSRIVARLTGTAASLLFLVAAGLRAGETCVRVSDHAGNAGQEVKAADLGAVRVTAAKDANGTTVPMVLADCTNDGGADLIINWSGEEASPPVRMSFAGACGGAAPVEVKAVLLTGNAILRAHDTQGILVDSVAAGPNYGIQQLVLAHPGGIATVDIIASQSCLLDVCWQCPEAPASRLNILPAKVAACGGTGTLAIQLEAAEPVAGFQLGLRWDRAALEVLAVRPGAAVPAERIQSFNTEIESAESGLEPGEAIVSLFLVPGAALGPGQSIEVLSLDVRATGAAAPANGVALCLADGLGKPPLAMLIHAVEGNQNFDSKPPAACGVVALTPDHEPPALVCPGAKVVEGGEGGAVVSWQVKVDDECPVEVTCEPPSGSFFPLGTTTVVCRAVDGAGNRAKCSFEVTVIPQDTGFRRADANGDGVQDISDAVAILGFLFLGEARIGCPKTADANDDGSVDISDAASLLGFLFLGGLEPPPPFGFCGEDPTPDNLSCEAHAPCQEGPVPTLFTERLLERLDQGDFPELQLVETFEKQVAYQFARPGEIDEGTMTSWSGGIALAGPQRLPQLGRPTQLKYFDGQGQEVKDTWYHLGRGRLARLLTDGKNRAMGLYTVGVAGSLFALDVDFDGVADLLDVIDPDLGEVLLVDRKSGMAYLERIIRRLSGRSSRVALTSLIRGPTGRQGVMFDPIEGLREVLGSRDGRDGPEDLASEPLLASLLWLLERQPLADNVPTDPSLALSLPDLARVAPGVPVGQQIDFELADHPVIEDFSAAHPSCTVAYNGSEALDFTTLSWRVSPSLGGSPIVSVRLYVLGREKHVRWDPHVIRSSYSIELIHAAPGAPDGSAVTGSHSDLRSERHFTTRYALVAENAAGRRSEAMLSYSYVIPIDFPAWSYVRESVWRREWVEAEDCFYTWWQYSIPVNTLHLERLSYQIRFVGDADFRPSQPVPYLTHDPSDVHPYRLNFLSRLPCDRRWDPWRDGHGNVRGIRLRAESVDDCSTFVEDEVEVRLIETPPEPEPEPPPPTPSGPLPDLVTRLRDEDVGLSVRPRVRNLGTAGVTSPFTVRVGGRDNHYIRVEDPLAPRMYWVDDDWWSTGYTIEDFGPRFAVSADTFNEIDEGENELNNGQSCNTFGGDGWECTPAAE